MSDHDSDNDVPDGVNLTQGSSAMVICQMKAHHLKEELKALGYNPAADKDGEDQVDEHSLGNYKGSQAGGSQVSSAVVKRFASVGQRPGQGEDEVDARFHASTFLSMLQQLWRQKPVWLCVVVQAYFMFSYMIFDEACSNSGCLTRLDQALANKWKNLYEKRLEKFLTGKKYGNLWYHNNLCYFIKMLKFQLIYIMKIMKNPETMEKVLEEFITKVTGVIKPLYDALPAEGLEEGEEVTIKSNWDRDTVEYDRILEKITSCIKDGDIAGAIEAYFVSCIDLHWIWKELFKKEYQERNISMYKKYMLMCAQVGTLGWLKAFVIAYKEQKMPKNMWVLVE